MRKYIAGAAAAVLLSLMTATAQAKTPAHTTTSVHLRAGPGTNYPVIATMPQDASIEVHGCRVGYDWCDASWHGSRGWVAASYILTDNSSGQRSVLTPAVAAGIGLSVVAFNQAYWTAHYSDYPWYPHWNNYYGPYYPYGPYYHGHHGGGHHHGGHHGGGYYGGGHHHGGYHGGGYYGGGHHGGGHHGGGYHGGGHHGGGYHGSGHHGGGHGGGHHGGGGHH